MKVYTKTGDRGETGLLGGARVPKDHPRLEAYGSIDELNAQVGGLRALDLDSDLDTVLEEIQHGLFAMGAELARPESETLAEGARRVGDEESAALEKAIDRWENELTPLTHFILPGGSPAAAQAHIARAVVRRAERRLVTLNRESTVSPALIKYLNRLSDCLFVLARVLNKRAGRDDVAWQY
jgi:cob(I)alamin adenosyltransferase